MENTQLNLDTAIYSDFAPLWAHLRGHGFLWHQTPLTQLEAILSDEAIVPNAGQFPSNYSQTKRSFARHLGAVALFDFDTSNEVEIANVEWKDMLLGMRGPGVLICIAAHALDVKKLLRPDAFVAGDSRLDALPERIRKGGGIIPAVEALYLGAIRTAAIHRFYLTALAGSRGYLWHAVERNDQALAALRFGTEIWNTNRVREADERRARGEPDLEQLVGASFHHRTGPEL